MNYAQWGLPAGFNVPHYSTPSLGNSVRAQRVSQTDLSVGCVKESFDVMGLLVGLASVAVVATFNRSHKQTVVKTTRQTQEGTSTNTNPSSGVDKPPPNSIPTPTPRPTPKVEPEPTVNKPASNASREEKHAWLTAKKVDHKYGHLNYSSHLFDETKAVKVGRIDPNDISKRTIFLLHADAANAYKDMASAAQADGITLELNSAYRSKADQQKEWDAKVAENKTKGLSTDPDEISKTVAPEGHSEHCTGYAVDFDLSPSGVYDTKTDDWIKANAAKYGFVNSFTEGNMQGVNAEPWHWRFEGNAKYPDTNGGAAKAFKVAHDLEKLK